MNINLGENKKSGQSSSSGDAWYTIPGVDDDIILSHRVRFARNLANYPFPNRLSESDSERVMAIIFDSFNSLPDGDKYQTIAVSNLDQTGKVILRERGIYKEPQKLGNDEAEKNIAKGLIVRSDGKISCSVNSVDHLRLSAFSTGTSIQETSCMLKNLDEMLQKKMQFAASLDFGYLTSNIMDAGSGMKLSMRLHLPCISLTGKLHLVNEIVSSRNLSLSACFGAGQQGASLGAYYEISTRNRLNGSEKSQELDLLSVCCDIMMKEKSSREDALKNLETSMRNIVYRALTLARSSLFMSSREAIDIISGIKLGKNLNLLKGIADTELNALLFRIQDGHLEYVLKNGNFDFESEVAQSDAKKILRLRSLILQEAFEKIELV